MDINYAYYTSAKGYRIVNGTATQFLKADGSVDNRAYVNKTGDSMTGTLNMGTAVAGVVKKDLSTITAASGFARDILQLTGSNGVIDAMGWFGSVEADGSVKMNYGYVGATSYSATKALVWTSDQRVGIGLSGTSLPLDGYRLHVSGNSYTSGNIGVAGTINSTAGELLVQRMGVNRIRTGSAATIISADGSSGSIYLRPQGDTSNAGQVIVNANNTTQFVDAHNLLLGTQTTAGSSVFHTNLTNTTHGYGVWLGQNLQFNGTDFIQPRGTLNSWGFSVNNHKYFSFNYGKATGANGDIPSLSEVVKINNTGRITTLNDGSSEDWNSGFPTNYANSKASVIYSGDLLATPAGTYSAFVSTASTNKPFQNVGGLISVGITSSSMSFKLLGARDNSDNLWFQSGDGTGAFRQVATRDWVSSQLSNYHTKSEALSLFVGKTGAESISGTKTFINSPIIPNASSNGHAVNFGQMDAFLTATLSGFVPLGLLGVQNGVATLGTDGKVPSSQLPSSAGIKVNEEFSTITGSGFYLSDDYMGGEVGLYDKEFNVLVAGRENGLHKFGATYGGSGGVIVDPVTGHMAYGGVAPTDSHNHYFNGTIRIPYGIYSESSNNDDVYGGSGNLYRLAHEVIMEDEFIRFRPDDVEFHGSSNIYGSKNRVVKITLLEGGDIIMQSMPEYQEITIMNISGNQAKFRVNNTNVNFTIPPKSSARYYMNRNGRIIQESLNVGNCISS
ncbi:hypothetical protein [Chryseobacterium shandongense]|jgi:hypothetical protein|uniref:hypothetical protein n=1 Tax=Chryseobacterium shandongense TaxID=1493872 RepID=UPI000F50F159|nr:hypothetical protein [Chryseobacterium shandongense]AZA57080.1 hypothetical protein EG350_07765 [Chryseobacterium shandongense]